MDSTLRSGHPIDHPDRRKASYKRLKKSIAKVQNDEFKSISVCTAKTRLKHIIHVCYFSSECFLARCAPFLN